MANLIPQAKAYLEQFYEMPLLQTLKPEEVRDMFAQMPAADVELAPLAKMEDKQIPVSDDANIGIRIYTPEGEGPFPLFVYYHGGGWVIGDLETADATCRMIANKTERVVVSVDYRLAPEYKFPIPLEDSYAALEWVSEHAASINGSASNIVVAGDSAGGNLATAVSMMSRDRQGPPIAAQVLIYPVTDLSYNTGSYQEFGEGFGLDRDLMIWFGDYYINHEIDAKNIYAAPLLAQDVSGLPPAFVATAECDVLRDEGMAYAKRLQEAGIHVEAYTEPGLIHGFFTNMAVFPEQIKGTIEKMDQFLAETKKSISL
ncbi:acetyl esterase [Alteribacillus persepolensis]|uniref:Acetyl esterase n=1 Tax=Alteribacillus persepolensis TaxID=568899 RepID=A0A1G8H2G2_9BACI|nr:alpha/beta hydrolase [Alteribacillus persepolensis]SDI00741.1 acetyl esterase [Alteribacillus persepolensis]